MAQRCTVCAHPRRRRIDRELAADELSFRELAARYGLSKSALARHWENHFWAEEEEQASGTEAGQTRQAGQGLSGTH
jgi:DNA-binding transcriptional ArsR family regulator